MSVNAPRRDWIKETFAWRGSVGNGPIVGTFFVDSKLDDLKRPPFKHDIKAPWLCHYESQIALESAQMAY